MDPVSRRTMWDVLAAVCKLGSTAIVLTTHSMEECEALCSRIAIMVGGRVRLVGCECC
jgi:ABC-type multidrug transport system ATPase subunit